MYKDVNSSQTILQLKRIFSGHGILDILFIDNGPQFDLCEFANFSTDWQFHPDELKPATPDYDHIRGKEREYHAKLKFNYDQKHRVVEGEEVSPGDCIWIPNLKAEGTAIKQHESPRSVVIKTSNG